MTKKTRSNRAQVSVRGGTYDKISIVAKDHDKTVSALVDELCTKFLDGEPRVRLR